MLTLIVVVAGCISFYFLGLDLLPEIDYPIVTVATNEPATVYHNTGWGTPTDDSERFFSSLYF